VTSYPVTLRWLGTAGFSLEHGGEELLLDPFLSRPEGAFPEIEVPPGNLGRASLVLVSHGHFDHAMDVPLVARACPGARIFAPRASLRWMAREGVDPARLFANEDHESTPFGASSMVRILPSRHIRFDPLLVARTTSLVIRGGAFLRILRLAARYPLGSNSEFLLELGGLRILFSGSGGGDYERLAALEPDVFLCPFAGRTDVVEHYSRALRALRPRTVVLHHFDRFFPSFCVDYPVEEFERRVRRDFPGVELVVPEPLRPITLSPR
jgi:L-ascorbate metabolism protein UlaG (beta-lactamase superfamily)